MKVQDAGNHPDDADAEAEQDRSREGDEEEAPESRPPSLKRSIVRSAA